MNRRQAAIEAIEVFVEAKTATAEYPDDLINPIAKQKTAVHHGNMGPFQRQQLSIQINRRHRPNRLLIRF